MGYIWVQLGLHITGSWSSVIKAFMVAILTEAIDWHLASELRT